MRFLVDAQLPPALARRLESQGHEAEHVADRDLMEADDREIWRVARDLGAVLVTKDGDFAVLRTLESDGPIVLWIRLGNTRLQSLLNWFEGVLPQALESIAAGETLIELT